MKTRQEIFKEILADQAITDIVVGISAKFKTVEDLRHTFADYYRLCGTLSDHVNAMDLPGEHSPADVKGIGRLIPFITIGMPGLHTEFMAHWGDEFLAANGVDPLFFEEEGVKARDLGEAGEANYLHGLLVVSLIGDTFVQLAGTQLMVAAAVNLEQGLEESGSAGVH